MNPPEDISMCRLSPAETKSVSLDWYIVQLVSATTTKAPRP